VQTNFRKRVHRKLWHPLFLWGYIEAHLELRRIKKRQRECARLGHVPTMTYAGQSTVSATGVPGWTQLTVTSPCLRCGAMVTHGP
jgi:hypothetical protein